MRTEEVAVESEYLESKFLESKLLETQPMEFEFIEWMWSDLKSGGGGSPALYKVPGGYAVQGKKIGAGARAQVRNLTDDEDVVFVPDNVLDRLREQR
jgi:hypothetical protein